MGYVIFVIPARQESFLYKNIAGTIPNKLE
jgi:hypothetical protein